MLFFFKCSTFLVRSPVWHIWLVLVLSAAGWGFFQYLFNRLIHTVAANYHWQN